MFVVGTGHNVWLWKLWKHKEKMSAQKQSLSLCSLVAWSSYFLFGLLHASADLLAPKTPTVRFILGNTCGLTHKTHKLLTNNLTNNGAKCIISTLHNINKNLFLISLSRQCGVLLHKLFSPLYQHSLAGQSSPRIKGNVVSITVDMVM